jgi:hypothetical protein
MRDFNLMPSINCWSDGEKYFANLDWQENDEEKIELSANSAGALASKVSSAINTRIIKLSKQDMGGYK